MLKLVVAHNLNFNGTYPRSGGNLNTPKLDRDVTDENLEGARSLPSIASLPSQVPAPIDGLEYASQESDISAQSGTYAQLSNFWTAGNPVSRPGSVHSLSSSMNSSLHGYPSFDPQEQDPVFTDSRQRSASSSFGTMSAGLPPPPVRLDQARTFDCDICGESIRVQRRLEWQ